MRASIPVCARSGETHKCLEARAHGCAQLQRARRRRSAASVAAGDKDGAAITLRALIGVR